MKVKLSVIVPIYKVEEYLECCLESIINQTYKELEIILVNDGSPDRCIDICNRYKNLDNRIIIINKENGGLSSARNKGLDVATGKYIAFVDSDDYIKVDMYENLIRIVEKEKADIVQCGFQRVHEEGEVLNQWIPKLGILNTKKEILNAYFEEGGIHSVVWNKLYKKDLFKDIRMVEGRNNEDTMVTPEILLRANKVINIDSVYYNYLQRDNTIMSSKFNEKKLDKIYAGKYVISLCNRELKEYICHANVYNCLNIIQLYMELEATDVQHMNTYKGILQDEFNKSYLNTRKIKAKNKYMLKSKTIIHMFKYNKKICIYLYKYYQKKKGC